jgi:hypothetical protein
MLDGITEFQKFKQEYIANMPSSSVSIDAINE